MTLEAERLTVEQFWAQYAGQPYELVNGEVVKIMPAGGESPEIELLMGGAITQFVVKNKLGKTTGAEGGYWITPDNLRAPDIAFYGWEKHKQHTDTDSFRPFPPDLAVEIISPTDAAQDIRDKVNLYRAAGVRLIWEVYPKSQMIIVNYPDGSARTLTTENTLSGEDVLPGFELPVADCFPTAEE